MQQAHLRKLLIPRVRLGAILISPRMRRSRKCSTSNPLGRVVDSYFSLAVVPNPAFWAVDPPLSHSVYRLLPMMAVARPPSGRVVPWKLKSARYGNIGPTAISLIRRSEAASRSWSMRSVFFRTFVDYSSIFSEIFCHAGQFWRRTRQAGICVFHRMEDWEQSKRCAPSRHGPRLRRPACPPHSGSYPPPRPNRQRSARPGRPLGRAGQLV
jgi:hypothetical protein